MELQKKTNRRSLLVAGAAAVAAAGAGAIWWARKPRGGPAALKARQVQGEVPVNDPDNSAWKSAPSVTVPVVPQQMFYPKLKNATIQNVTVRALFNGSQLGLQAEWQDRGKDELESIVGFRDALAVMLPLQTTGELPPIFMGSADRPVYVLHWKASWQLDLEKGFQGVEASYPNWFNDVYPDHPTLMSLGMTDAVARQFYPGLALGNPLSVQQRTTAVEELTAEGFGTLTSLPQQRAGGRGVFAGGRWKVSVGVPAEGPDVPALKPGQTVPVAFAIWDGGQRQVGGRKHYADWVQVTLPGS